MVKEYLTNLKQRSCVIENSSSSKGYLYSVVFRANGYRCGYVAIPKGHPAYGMDYNDILVTCHGGLTYGSNYIPGYENVCINDVYWIGFDCAHYGDGYDFKTAKRFFKDEPDIIRSIERTQSVVTENFEPKSLEFCIEQCKGIIDQLIEMEKEA